MDVVSVTSPTSLWRAVVKLSVAQLTPRNSQKIPKQANRWSTEFLKGLLVQLTAQQADLFDICI